MTYWKALTATGKLIAAGAIILLLVVAFLTVRAMFTAGPKAEAKLGRNTTEAASASGSDAVNTVGEQGKREADSADLTRENERDIRNAEGADAKISPAARAAILRSVCKRAAYRSDPKCVQPTPAR